ncbi:DUF4062 domain-containing protein [Marinomonas atlantica]|uniref:DUF4062 domain-containing protein n=1 Tax=Marinomonas atlantica TaxID=1806668 RepID=UPI000833F30E|nr:DUF4062 domain-containing protein [Marinomonas atlantica]
MSDKIKIMLSSTIQDMKAERDAVVKLFGKYPFVEVVGAYPIQEACASNPYLHTLRMAESCDFYILLLGERYGFELDTGVSATEAEFDQAYKSNPTKVLVFQGAEVTPEEKQQEFIKKVGDYYKGYWISKYQFSHDLQDVIEKSFLKLLKERASLGENLSYVDHFLRLVLPRRPNPDASVFYSVNHESVELKYEWGEDSHHINFMRSKINSDFWGCISELEKQFSKWRK